jgi:acetylornithine/succinyldiaminopimelate/putrescine aminotransferase
VNERELFLKHVAQTSPSPLLFEIAKAEGCLLYDKNGRDYIDLIGGISVANVGHRHPKVVEAIKKQLDAYMHVMVYGEFIESSQVLYAKLLTDHLPPSLNSVYFTNSGAEAIEGSMKLAKRVMNRTQIIAFKHSYHGSTQGALSIIGDEYWRNAFRPLLPDVLHLDYNSFQSIEEISERTACVILEPVQAEAGIIAALPHWLKAIRKKCNETGTLLIFDEIQTGFGRTGELWGFENFKVIPDVLVLGKALGGGMPLGAFIAGKSLMNSFIENPVLGHITTFGGHPVSCAAGMAAMKALLEEKMFVDIKNKEELFRSLLVHKKIIAVRSYGLWLAIEFEFFEQNKKIIDECIRNGVMTDWFLFASQSLRISPPLIISQEQITKACQVLIDCCNRA